MLAYVLATCVGILSILWLDVFPACFVEGHGLTGFKIINDRHGHLFGDEVKNELKTPRGQVMGSREKTVSKLTRRLVFAVFCYFLGGIVYLFPGLDLWILIPLIVMGTSFMLINLPHKGLYLLVAVVFFLTGATVFTIHGAKANMIRGSVGRWAHVEGTVEPVIGENCFLVNVESLKVGDRDIGYQGGLMVYPQGHIGTVTAGTKMAAEGQLKVSDNRGYRNYCRGLGAEALFYSTPYHIRIINTKPFSVKYHSRRAARWVKGLLEDDARVPPVQGEIMKGLLLGGGETGEKTRSKYSKVGLSHLLAVSGLHVGIICAVLFWLLKRFGLIGWDRFFIVLTFLIFFSFMVGLTPSVVRATIMMGILLLATAINRKPDMLTSLFLAAFLLTIFKPYSIYSISFQLSFLACLGIALFNGPFKRIFAFMGTYISGAVSITLASQILILPLLIHYFGEFAPVSVLANILAVPLAAVVLWLTVLYVVLFALHIPLYYTVIWLNGIIIKGMDLIITGAGRIPYGNISVEYAGPKFFVVYYASIHIIFLLLDYDTHRDKVDTSEKAG